MRLGMRFAEMVDRGGLVFAHGALEVMSQELVRRLGPLLETCMENLINFNLGRGSADIDLAYCLWAEGGIVPEKLGPPQELLLKNCSSIRQFSLSIRGWWRPPERPGRAS